MRLKEFILLAALTVFAASCRSGNVTYVDEYPDIFPDYIGVTIPESMVGAMMKTGFQMADGSKCKAVRILKEASEGQAVKAGTESAAASVSPEGQTTGKTSEGQAPGGSKTLWISIIYWKNGSKISYKPFPIYISGDEIDPYIAYRLIEPGYESWHDMGIYQRELASFKESAIVTNKVNDRGCVNCHTFASGDPGRMIFHARGAGGGTVFINARGSSIARSNGSSNASSSARSNSSDRPARSSSSVSLLNLAENGPKRQGAYTAWHPDGRYIAFSSNDTHQSFYSSANQPIEVYDLASDLILMDLETDEITVPVETENTLETFPAWSSDGKKLYFCCSDDPGNLPFKRNEVRYKLMSMDFEEGKFTGAPQTVLDLEGISISFPRIKGNRLMFTASDFGTFPIWHDEADLWTMDLNSGEAHPADELNSSETESYHSWSSNGKWVIFSSRRIDGRYTRLFIAHCNEDGSFSKPFLLPQKDPKHNQLRLKSYNIPEFVKGKVSDRQRDIAKLF